MTLKIDQKLLKKVSHSKLIKASQEAGIKNADKVSKEQLVFAFVEQVEKLSKEKGKLTGGIVEMYNSLLSDLGWEEGVPSEEEAPAEEAPAEEAPAEEATEPEKAAPTPAAKKPLAMPKAVPKPTPKAAPAPTPKAASKVEGEKPKRVPPPRKTTMSRAHSIGKALLEDKSGKVEAMLERADEIYVEAGGKTNLRESKGIFKFCYGALEAMGILTITGEDYKVNLK